MRSTLQGARSRSPWANTSACHAPIAASTSSGGWTPPAFSISATTPWMTSSRARRVPSPQLIGTPERATLDLNTLSERGVNIVGRLVGVNDGVAQFSGSLRNHCAMADLKLTRLLDTIDAWVARGGNCGTASAPERFAATRVDETPRLSLDLANQRIGTVIWATGFRPDYSWLQVPARSTARDSLLHDGGVAARTRAVRARIAFHAQTEVVLHSRRRR